mmetsp:Transcript_19591/g.56193  ORF Transcript_19591/g.56193 Transcript_19591/m.56193 type:complete len:176 (-) Transcript_19591:38-565(-)
MATVGGDTNKIPKGLRRFTREGGIINRIKDGLVPMESKEGAHIHRCAKQDSQRDLPIQRLASGTVQHHTDVLETQEPAGFRAARAVHGKVGKAFRGLVTPFHGVLVLSVWFAGPLPNTESTKDVQDTSTAEILGMVTQQPGGSTALTNDIFQSIDELFIRLHAKHIHDMRSATAE